MTGELSRMNITPAGDQARSGGFEPWPTNWQCWPHYSQADLDAARAQGAATERDKMLTVLAEHYLMMVICNEETHQDNPVCGCSRVFLGWHPSIGAARQAWIDHVASVLDGTP